MTDTAQHANTDARNPELSIVIPCYNEIVRLPRTMQDVEAWLKTCGIDVEVVFVDDGSKDATAAWAQAYSENNPYARLVTYGTNRGKGYAVKTGMLAARGSYRLFMDADGSTPVSHASQFLQIIKGSGIDIVIGSRKEIGAQLQSTQSFPRRVASGLFGLLTRMFVVYGIKDTQCGFKMFTSDATEKIFAKSTVTGAIFDIELMLLAAKNNLVVREVPVTWTHDNDSRLTYNLVKSAMVFVELLKVKCRHRIVLPRKVKTA